MFIKGKDVYFYIEMQGVSVPLVHARTAEITTYNGVIPTTTFSSGKGETNNYSRKYSYTIKAEGLTFIGDQFNGFDLQTAQVNFNKINWTMTDNSNIQWFGIALVTQTTFDANFDALSTFSGDLLGDGEYTFIESNVPPIPPIGASVSIVDQFNNLIALVPAPGTYQVTKFDTIDLRFVDGSLNPVTPQIVVTA